MRLRNQNHVYSFLKEVITKEIITESKLCMINLPGLSSLLNMLAGADMVRLYGHLGPSEEESVLTPELCTNDTRASCALDSLRLYCSLLWSEPCRSVIFLIKHQKYGCYCNVYRYIWLDIHMKNILRLFFCKSSMLSSKLYCTVRCCDPSLAYLDKNYYQGFLSRIITGILIILILIDDKD